MIKTTKNTTRCAHCGKQLPLNVILDGYIHCDSTCTWFANERATRRLGTLRRDADGDWQENPDGDFGADRW